MCLAVIARNMHARFGLIIVANRDEYHARPTQAAHIWRDHPHVLAGRDLRAGGTWLGLSARGKIALLTNYREPGNQNPDAPSRGALVSNFLTNTQDAKQYAQATCLETKQFNGFNLLLADANSAHYVSNRAQELDTCLADGVHGLSNATLDIAWPKVTRTQAAVSALLTNDVATNAAALFEIFRDTTPANVSELPSTGLTAERELQLSSPFILDDVYGTRCSTVVMADRSGKTYFEERTFNNKGEVTNIAKWQLDNLKQIFSQLT